MFLIMEINDFRGDLRDISSKTASLVAGNQAVLMDRPGTSLWGGVCSVGSEQSPVDIKLKEKFGRTTAPKLDEGKITCMYNVTENCTVSNTGHGSMQVCHPPQLRKHVIKHDVHQIFLS